jgi:hypothetical protein
LVLVTGEFQKVDPAFLRALGACFNLQYEQGGLFAVRVVRPGCTTAVAMKQASTGFGIQKHSGTLMMRV